MEIFKRGKYWNYRFEMAKIGGKRQRAQKGGFRTKKEAESAGMKAKNEFYNTGLSFSPSEISVSDYYELWLKNYCEINCRDTTIEGYSKRIKNYILPSIGKYRLSGVTAMSLQNLINDLFNRGFSRNTLTSIKGLLTGALDYAVQPLGFIQNNPAHAIRLPSRRAVPRVPTRTKEKIPLTNEQMDVIFNRFPVGHPAHIPLQLAFRLGLREGESFALTWDDVNFNEQYISINKQVQIKDGTWIFVPPKYDSYRIVYMDSKLTELLKSEKEKQEINKLKYKGVYCHYALNDKNGIIKSKNEQNEIHLVI